MAAGCDRCGFRVDAGRAGIATLAVGTTNVAAPAVTANSIIYLTPQPGTTPLALPWVSALNPGVGFTITSLSVTDTDKVGWLILEPGG